MAASVGKLIVGKNDGRYYLERVATGKHDYYTGEGEAPGVWAGKGAEALRLQGEVLAEQFLDVLACRNPLTGEKLKRRANSKVLGFDVTFSAPKSVSALYAIACALGDERIIQAVVNAHDQAVLAAIAELEDSSCIARLGTDGVDRQPGIGFIVATFRHRISRAGDPQLHTHSVIANIVQTADGRASAYDGTLTYRHCKAAGSVYLGALRHQLRERLGVEWTDRNGQWEIAGIPVELCQLWSKRRHEIQDLLDEWEQTSARAAQYAALASRNKKDHTDHDPGLASRWEAEAVEAGLDLRHIVDELDLPIEREAQLAPVGLSDADVLEVLVGPEGLTEKACGFGRRDVLVGAERLLGPSGVTRQHLHRIADQVLADQRVLDLRNPAQRNAGEIITVRDPNGRPIRRVCTAAERRYTTTELVQAELEVLHRIEQGRDRHLVVIPDAVVEQVLAQHPGLDADQEAMVRGLCASGNFLDVVEGRAGTGKSYALGVYRQTLHAAGYQLIGLAPSATAAHVLGESAGITQTDTVHGLLARLDHTGYQLALGTVIVLDEAAMCDTRTLLRLVRAADHASVKLIAVGDDRQIPSVDAGGLFTALTHRLGTFALTVNHRFIDLRQRDAAEQLRDRNADAAITAYQQLGLLQVQPTVTACHKAMLGDWLDLIDQGQTARMLADTNRIVSDLNIQARHALRDRGVVAKGGHTYRDRDTGRKLHLAAGDRVRLGRNDAQLPCPDGRRVEVRNGMEGQVARTARGWIEVQLDDQHVSDGQPGLLILPASYVAADIDYAYALTCNKAQGATIDHALYHPTDRASAERAYVALSRGRLTNRLYAVAGTGWEQALGATHTHTPAASQQPDTQAARRLRDQRDERAGQHQDKDRGRPIAM